ncbi:MAG: rhamnulokinase family protein [Christensenellaceae bacterium]|nr:rhamnulokinase family protein [Christensenellaceae bacterium]MEA5068884.1 rhamnulokinase family protein [Christensenellaceae bacterium]
MNYLAFDLGASSGKMFLGRFDGETLSIDPVHSFQNGIVQMGQAMYWDFPGIWRNLAEGIGKACAVAQVASIGLDGYNNDFTFVDRRGELLFPVRAYRDPRTIEHERAIYRRIPPRELYLLTGNQLAPFNTWMQLAAMVENGQQYLFDHADNLLMLPDLLVYLLTGNRVMEYTLAAQTQMLDLNTRTWIARTLDAIGFPKRLFAPLVMPGTHVGSLTEPVRQSLGVPGIDVVSVCEHDTASAFLAAPIDRDCAIISSGTWSLVGMEADLPIITEYGYAHNIANEGSLPGHHRLLKNVMGSWLLQELMRDWAQDGIRFSYEQMQAEALGARPFQHLIDANDRRFYSPGEMRRKIRSASLEHTGRAPETPGEYFRVVYEALALQYRRSLEALETFSGRRLTRISIIGGGSLDALACQFTADAANRPVVAGPADGTAIGNMLVQMLACGEIASIAQGREVVKNSCAFREYTPQSPEEWEAHDRLCADRLS